MILWIYKDHDHIDSVDEDIAGWERLGIPYKPEYSKWQYSFRFNSGYIYVGY